MAIEIERRFLVSGSQWRQSANTGTDYRQGYLSIDQERTIRVRVSNDGAYITVKGPMIGFIRSEYEYSIPTQDAEQMLQTVCLQPIIEKTRYRLTYQDVDWEIDEFHSQNRGLIVAEVELEAENQVFEPPEWIGEEVTENPRYLNSQLVAHPFLEW